jgi:hypothetical protein
MRISSASVSRCSYDDRDAQREPINAAINHCSSKMVSSEVNRLGQNGQSAPARRSRPDKELAESPPTRHNTGQPKPVGVARLDCERLAFRLWANAMTVIPVSARSRSVRLEGARSLELKTRLSRFCSRQVTGSA